MSPKIRFQLPEGVVVDTVVVERVVVLQDLRSQQMIHLFLVPLEPTAQVPFPAPDRQQWLAVLVKVTVAMEVELILREILRPFSERKNPGIPVSRDRL